MAGLIGAPGTPFTITFDDPSAATLGLMVGMLCTVQKLNYGGLHWAPNSNIRNRLLSWRNIRFLRW